MYKLYYNKIVKSILLGVLIVYVHTAFAQDKIITNSDQIITAFNIEIGNSTVFYTVSEDVNSETKRIPLAEILVIKKSDGTMINPTDINSGENSATNIQKKSSDDIKEFTISPETKELNRKIIEGLNKKYEFLNSAPINAKKKTNGFIRQYGVSDNSILETDELSMGAVINQWNFKVWAKNKTDHIIYIDLGNTFYSIYSEAICAYEPKITNISNSSSGGGSVNLGGIAGALGIGGALGTVASGVNIGGGNTKSITEATISQRLIAIPPHEDKVILEKISFPTERCQVIRQWSFKGDSKWGITYKGDKQSEGFTEDVTYTNGAKDFSIYFKYYLNESMDGPSGVMNAEFFPVRNLYCYDGHEIDDLIGKNEYDRFWIRFWGKVVK